MSAQLAVYTRIFAEYICIWFLVHNCTIASGLAELWVYKFSKNLEAMSKILGLRMVT